VRFIGAPIALVCASVGCMGQVLARGSADHLVEGAAVGMEAPILPLRIGTEAGYERLATPDGERRGVAGVDVTLRAGLVSTILRERCYYCPHKPWVELGPMLGAGLALTGDLDMIGHGVGGGWLEIRLSPASSYAVLRVELQRDMYSSRVEGNTQLVVGLGYIDWDMDLRDR
jgi:hypothetical protein